MPHFDTAANVVSNAALELGLTQAALANPWASTDQNIIQLRTLLTRAGRMLVRARAWSQLIEEYTFATVAATDSYALPTGFERFLNSTAWNRDTTLPLGEPLSPEQWQAVQAQTTAGSIIRPFRIRENLLYVYPEPTAAETIAYEYVSRYWVVESPATAPTSDTADAATDVLWLDEPLIVAALKLAWMRAKQEDTTFAQAEYDDAFRAASGGDGAAPTIVISGGATDPFIGYSNVPDTGYGS